MVMRDKLRIAMVGLKGIPAKWGGIEKYVEEIGKRLVQRGHEVTVFGSRWYCEDYKEDFYKGIRIRRVPTIHSQAADALSNAFFAALVIIFSNYDIVHFHGYASYYFIPFIKAFGKRTVITAHGVESGWDNPKYSCLARKIIFGAFRVGIYQAHQVTTVANHLKSKIERDFGIKAEVLTSGIVQEKVQPPQLIKEKYGLQGEDYVLFLGRIDPIKRVEWVLDTKELLSDNFKIVIAGGAQDSSSNAYLQILEQKHKCDPRIIFTGPVFGDEKAELYSNCILFLSPSQDEGLPITLLEACSYGKCSIVTDIEAYREVIKNGLNGFLFPKDDKNEFINITNKVINMPAELIKNMGLEAKKTVEARFSWDVTLHSYEKLYSDLLSSSSRN